MQIFTLKASQTKIKVHLISCVLKFIEEELKIKTTAIKNAAKRPSNAEHLTNNKDGANKHKISKLNKINHCF